MSVVVRSMARPSLAAALQSLAAQRAVQLEVLVVAACGPAHPIIEFNCGPHEMRLIPSAVPLRRAAAANVGLAAASGEWITFLDDDDIFKRGHIEGLLDAVCADPQYRVVHSFADAVFADGHHERFGQPYSLMQLYERNFIHLSSALVAHELMHAGCRFDESFDVHEDWDFFLQLAQHTRFAFVPVETFEWHADSGTSGAGGGANQDDARFTRFRDRVYEKWTSKRDDLIDRVSALVRSAAARGQQRDFVGAKAEVHKALVASPNDPFALNLLALLQRQCGELSEARATQQLAVDVRPLDPSMVYNLALVAMAQGDNEFARRSCARALSLDPTYAPAQQLKRQLDAAASNASGL